MSSHLYLYFIVVVFNFVHIVNVYVIVIIFSYYTMNLYSMIAKTLVSVGADGASVMQGQRNGLCDRL